MTLKECIDKYGFGVKFTFKKGEAEYWFKPLGFSQCVVYAIGEASDSRAQCWTLGSANWVLFNEQKPPKKLKLCTYVHYFIDKDCVSYSVISDKEFSQCTEKYPSDYQYVTTVKVAETEVEVACD